jgi:Zn ribbon nucleic-acid-binding protein
MWKLKACPRCEGDVFIDKDKEHDIWYEQCLQCGYQRELRVVCEFEAQPEREKEPVLAGRRRPAKK